MLIFKSAQLANKFTTTTTSTWEDNISQVRPTPTDAHRLSERLAIAFKLQQESESEGGNYYPGLLNAAGNLCFLNATLQSIASLPSLLAHLTHLTTHVPPSHPLPPVTTTLLLTLLTLNRASVRPCAPLRPVELARALVEDDSGNNDSTTGERGRRLLADGEQQDAMELWGVVREAVGEEEERRISRGLGSKSNSGSLASEGSGLGELLFGGHDDDEEEEEEGERWRGRGGGRGRRRPTTTRDPYLHLISQRIKCVTCGYTRDVRHTGEGMMSLTVPALPSCNLEDLLKEFTKWEIVGGYCCRRCSLEATRDRLVKQRDRLANNPATSTSTSNEVVNGNGNGPLSSPPPVPPLASNPPTNPAPPPTTTSRANRRRKVQKQLNAIEDAVTAGDFEREFDPAFVRLDRVEGDARRGVGVGRPPKILALHINRSTHFSPYASSSVGMAFKNPCQVHFPEYLDLGPFCDFKSSSSDGVGGGGGGGGGEEVYRLQSLVVHYGSHHFGHYVAFRRNPRFAKRALRWPPPPPPASKEEEGEGAPEWYRISDETVSPSGVDEVLRGNPFLMFYERVERDSDLVGEGEGEGGVGKGGEVRPRVFMSWMLGGKGRAARTREEVKAESGGMKGQANGVAVGVVEGEEGVNDRSQEQKQ
ncbi:cysteine proteinase [Meredithblackwellia eburnea MCA 4105]